MKSYILSLQFEYIEPIVWRKIIVPAGMTFKRLHDVIQNVTNFQSGYPHDAYHLYEFQLDDVVATNNLQEIEKSKKKQYNGLRHKQPQSVKIDSYVERMGSFLYVYDFGDDWRIQVKLEDMVDDYYFGYPTVLDWSGEAPPEDVGGPPGFAYFLSVYHDENHEEYAHYRKWATQQRYRSFDLKHVNNMLKGLQITKTQWDKIHHENYHVLSDKYRGTELETK